MGCSTGRQRPLEGGYTVLVFNVNVVLKGSYDLNVNDVSKSSHDRAG